MRCPGGAAGSRRQRTLTSGSTGDLQVCFCRCSSAGVLLVVIGPLSWLARNDPDDTLRVLLGTLAMPVALAIPVGMAFSKPTLWSDDLSVPVFVAVRPLSASEMVAVKVKVAALATAVSWLAVLAFLGAWLPWWANLDRLSLAGHPVVGVHDHSVWPCSERRPDRDGRDGLTWRFLVAGLVDRPVRQPQVVHGLGRTLVLVAIACVVFEADRLPRWMLEDPERMTALRLDRRFRRDGEVLACGALLARRLARGSFGSTSWPGSLARPALVALGVTLWGVMRIYLPLDIYRFQSLLILLALMVVPLVRLGLAPSSLAKRTGTANDRRGTRSPTMNRELAALAAVFSAIVLFLPTRSQTFTRVALDGRAVRMLVAR